MSSIDPDPVIGEPYLLVTHIPCYWGEEGESIVDELWAKDLRGHLRYLHDFRLAAPRAAGSGPKHAAPLDLGWQPLARMQVIDLIHAGTVGNALRALPANVARIWRAADLAAVVHTGVTGGVIPMGWLAAPIARLRGKLLVVNVESAPWRPAPGKPRPGWKGRLRSVMTEWMARRCVRLADVPCFTQAEYRSSLLGRHAARGHIVPASWIDEATVLSDAEARQSWDDRARRPTDPLHLVFAGRLVPEKGVGILLDALERLGHEQVPVVLTLHGAGPLERECCQRAAALKGTVRVDMGGVLPYGPEFFATMDRHHAVVVPNLGDEQPRIVFDAYARALPVLGSDTTGLRGCVNSGTHGMLAPPGDVAALAAMIRRAADHPEEVRRWGLEALGVARCFTHAEMHRRRAAIIREALDRHRTGKGGGQAAGGSQIPVVKERASG